MTHAQLIEIAEKLNKWLDDISAEYQIADIIRQQVLMLMKIISKLK